MNNSSSNTENDFINQLSESFLIEQEFNRFFRELVKTLFDKVKIISNNFLQKTFNPESDKLILLLQKSLISIENKIIAINQINDFQSKDSEQLISIYSIDIQSIINELEKQTLENITTLENYINICLAEVSGLLNKVPNYPFVEGDENLIFFDINELANEIKNRPIETSVYQDNFESKYSALTLKLKQNIPIALNKSIIQYLNTLYSIYFKAIIEIKSLFKLTDLNAYKTDAVFFESFGSEILKNNSENLLKLFKKNFDGVKDELKSLNSDYNLFNNFFDSMIQLFQTIEIATNTDVSLNQTEAKDSVFINKTISNLKFISKTFYKELNFEFAINNLIFKVNQIIRQLFLQLTNQIFTNIVYKQNKLVNEINIAIAHHSNKNVHIENLFSKIEKPNLSLTKNIADVVESIIQQIKIQLNTISDKIELSENIKFDNLNIASIDEKQTKKIFSHKIVDEIVGINLFETLDQQVSNLASGLNEVETDITNLIRLVRFSVFKLDNNQKLSLIDDENIDSLKFLNEKLLDAILINQKVEELASSLANDLSKSFNVVQNKLTLSYLKSLESNFGQHIPKKDVIKGISKLRKLYSHFINYFDRLINKFWAHQSNAIILVDNALEGQKHKSPVNNLLNFVEPRIKSAKALARLPFYYRQLFLNQTIINNEFWFGRTKEIEAALTAFNRFKSGLAGGLMITGDRFSGKSFLANYICSEILKSDSLLNIDTPQSGKADTEAFLKKLQEKSGIKGDFVKIFSSFDDGVIVVIDDLELWWEKSENGSLVVQQIMALIEEFGSKVFFIVTISAQSLSVLEKTIKVQDYFLDIIFCNPLNSRTLEDIVMMRHRTSDLKFTLKSENSKVRKRTERAFKSRNFARLFSKYFRYSHGNVGICLLAWIANIIDINEKQIIMKLPEIDDIQVFNNFSKDQILLLYQLYIHKKMDIAKLSRVLLLSEKVIQEQLNLFHKTNIINSGSVYEINPFIDHFVLKFLKNNEML